MLTNAREDHVRSPKQARSQQRVDLILSAARRIIADRGSANLSIADVAAEAGITPGSIYQYFPNRSAVIAELAGRYLTELGEQMAERLALSPADYHSAADLIDDLVELFFQRNLQDPVMRDIMQGLVADKTLRELDLQDTQAKVDLVCNSLRPIIPSQRQQDFPLTVFLMIKFVESGVRSALDMPALEARRMVDRLKSMLRAIWLAEV